MAENSAIQWCDHTFNPWRGCTKVSPGCLHCYAAVNVGVKLHGIKWGPNGERRVASESMWKEPLKWNRKAEAEGLRRRVFCASLADVFEGPETMPAEAAEEIKAARRRLFDLIIATPNLDWLLLTKRPENVERALKEAFPSPFGLNLSGNNKFIDAWMDRVWLGTTVENQEQADKRIPELLKINAKVRFLSVEPMLELIELSHYLGYDERNGDGEFLAANGWGYDSYSGGFMGPTMHNDPMYAPEPGIHWVIVGGESGPKARPFNTAWCRRIVDQCQAADVACFVKQLGTDPFYSTLAPEPDDAEEYMRQSFPGPVEFSGHGVGTARPILHDKKGGDLNEWPEVLRVRQMPEVSA
jgi:protein gp37